MRYYLIGLCIGVGLGFFIMNVLMHLGIGVAICH